MNFRFLFRLVAIGVLGAVSVRAQFNLPMTFTYTGEGPVNDITDHRNWSGDGDHNSPFDSNNNPATPDSLIFQQADVDENSDLSFSGTFAAQNVTFQEDARYTFSGGVFALFGKVTLQDEACVTIESSETVALTDGCHTICIASGATLKVDGNIVDATDSSGKILLKGGGVLKLTGDNSFSGGVEVKDGELIVGSDTALGTGTLKLHGNTEFTPSTDVIISNKIILVGDGDGGYVDNEDGSSNMSLTGLICGAGGFDWCTSGTLTLTHANNTFSGGIDMRSGQLYVGANDAAGTGQLDLENCTTLGATGGTIELHNDINLETDDGKVTIDTSLGNLILMGDITGNGELKKIGGGILTLGGNSDFSGGVKVTAGTLYLASSSVDDDDISGPVGSDTLKLKNGTTLGVSPLASPSGIGLLNNIVLDSAESTNVNFDTTFGNLSLFGQICGASGITVLGSHTLTLVADDTYTGNTTINAGATLQLGNGGTDGSILGDVTDNGTLTFDHCNSLTFSGVISGSGGLTLIDGVNGFLNLTNTNTYTGLTRISGGYLSLGDGTTAGSIAGNVELDGTDTTGGGELRFDQPSNYTFSHNITGTGRVSDFGAGYTVTLSGSNNYTGGTFIHDGTLADSNSGGNFSSTSDVFIKGTGALQVNGNETVGGLENYTEDSVTTAGTVTIASGAKLTVSTNGSSLFFGVISGTGGSLAKSGSGTLSLDGANTFTGGTALNAGTLYVGNTSSLGTGTLTAAGGTTFGVGGPLTIANAIALTSGTVNLDLDSSTTLSGAISGSGILNLLSSGSTLTLSNANSSWTGGLTVAGNNSVSLTQNALGSGTLSFSNVGSSSIVVFSGSAPSIGGLSGASGETQVSLGNSATLTINQNGTSTYNGEITGTGASVIKSGSGTLTLSGSSSYSGGTTISGGTLIYGGNGAFGIGSVTINGGDLNIANGFTLSNPLVFSGPVTLGGNGTIGTLITAGSGVMLSPGNSPGTLSFSAGLVLAGGGALTFQVQDANGPAGTGYDLLSISGGLLNITATSGSRFTIDVVSLNGGGNAGAVSNFNSSSSYTWTFATSSSGINNFNANDFTINLGSFSNSLNGGTFAVTDSGSLLALQFTPGAVPEPSTWIMLAMGVVTLPFAFRRRRRG